MSKKRSLFIIALVLTVILLVGTFLFRKQLVYPIIYPIDNVFDEMYFSGRTNSELKFIFTNSFEFTPSITDCNFNDYKIYRGENWMDRATELGSNSREIYYNSENLLKKTRIVISFDFKNKTVSYVMLLEKENTDNLVKIQFDYDVSKNILARVLPTIVKDENNEYIVLSNDSDDINNFLKEHESGFKNCTDAFMYLQMRIIEDWTESNPKSRFSKDNYGKIIYKDNNTI